MAGILQETDVTDFELIPHALSFLQTSHQLLRISLKVLKKRKQERRVKDFSKRRLHLTMNSITEVLTERDYQRSFRMTHATFQKLLQLLGSELRRDEDMGELSKRPTVIPELRLAIFIRMMAGASVHDISTTYRVSRATVFRIFHETRSAVNKALSLPGLPDDLVGYRLKANEFQTSRSPPSPLPGCIGALDGITVRIKKPSESEGPAQYYSRKGYYSIPVQALCDSNYQFMTYSAKCVGSTHDALAHSVSALGHFLDEGKLPQGYWIAGDEAYTCTDSLVTPVPASLANDDEDAFNFYHSSLRMHVEQAFGMLVAKWPILRNIEFSVKDSIEIIGAAIKLHNFCLHHGTENESDHTIASDEHEKALRDSESWYSQHGPENENDSERLITGTRDDLIKIIKEGGYCRPPIRTIRLPDHLSASTTQEDSD